MLVNIWLIKLDERNIGYSSTILVLVYKGVRIIKEIRDLLKENKIIIYDGAMGTFLQQLGLKNNECPEIYNLNNKAVVQKVHTAYKNAGSDVVLTNTFGANRIKLKKYKLEDKVHEINTNAVKIAKEVMDGQGYVALSVGPTGEMYQPYGSLNFEEAYDIYAQQICAGAKAGAELIHIETMTDLIELKAAAYAALNNTQLPIVATMTFENNRRTLMGSDASTVANVIDGMGVDAVGVNCSAGPAELMPIAREMAAITDKPIIIQPNAGLPELKNGVVHYPLSPEDMYYFAKQMVKSGAQILGGCCGTGPEHIKNIKDAVINMKAIERKIDKRFISSGYNTLEFDDRLIDKYTVNKVNVSKDLSDNINRVQEVSMSEGDIVELDFQTIDASEMETAIESMNFIQSMIKKPLLFTNIMSKELLEGILKNYKGRAVIRSGSEYETKAFNAIINSFGAYVI
ncbi:MAG: homocysteine S-methyltransferase family protein [Clostridia bacterium]|nr:homocysteine S-methyltransferase family protein [Clostridia bacterium]